MLEGSRVGRGMGRESTGASQSVLKKQTDRSRLGEPSLALCESAYRLAGEGDSTQGHRTIHGRFQTASRFRTVRACFKCLVPSRRACGKTATGPPGGACPGRQQESGRPCASPTGPPAMRPTFTMSVCSRPPVGTLWWSYLRDILKSLASLRSDYSRSIGPLFTFAGIRNVLVTAGSSVAIASMHPPGNPPCRPPDCAASGSTTTAPPGLDLGVTSRFGVQA